METPEFHYTATEKRLSDAKHGGEHFAIEDLLDFPNDDGIVSAEASMTGTGTSTEDSAAVLLDSPCNSSFPYFHAAGIVGSGDGQFTSELCVPYDDMAELEWLSNIVDESFCSEDLQRLHLLQGIKVQTEEPPETHRHEFQPETAGPIPTEMLVPAKARSKRSRAAPGNWTSRLLAVSPTLTPTASSSSESEVAAGKKPTAAHKKKEAQAENSSGSGGGGEGRRCLHCATDKTPQWRTGPMGPKTLCNACGVRYKSGRLVPEYRPASSPTFVLAKHSNSHRKVLELRRQKEVQQAQQHQQQFLHHHHHHQSMMFDLSNSGADDYLIHQHIGPDFRQLI